jgi:hypothetical protein
VVSVVTGDRDEELDVEGEACGKVDARWLEMF